MASTSLDLSQIKTDALSAASTFRTLIGLGTLATQNGTISDYLTIATAASTYLSLTGGTLTGGLSGTTVTTSGLIKGGRFNTGIYEDNTAGFSTYQTSGHFFAGSHTTFAGSAIWSFRAGPGYLILNDASNGSQIRSSGQNALGGVFSIIGSTSTSPSNADHYMGFRFDGAFLSLPLMLGRLGTTAVASANEGAWLLGEASDTLGIRRSTNAQRLNLYGTYTDASNYRRLYLSSTTAGAFTLGVEGAGTGASGNTLRIPNRLGIGTNTPANFRWLDIVDSETTGNGLFAFITNTSTDIYSSSGWAMRVGVSNVGGNIAAFGTTFSNYGLTQGLNFSTSTATDNIAFRTGSELINGTGTAARFFISSGGNIGINTQSPTSILHLVGLSQTGLTASTEFSEVNFDLSSTKTFAAGNITTQRAFRIQAPTYSFASASTITTASTLSISGRPVAGTNATITDGYALNVESGNTILNGDLIVGVFGATTSRISFNRGVSSTYDMIQSYPEAIIFRRVVSGVATGFAKLEYALNEFGSYTGGLMLSVGGLSWNSGNAGNGQDIPNLCVMRDAADILAQRRSTNSQTFRLYNTITDASNYIRQSLSFTTYSTTVHAQLAAEGAGTGAVNVPFVITPRGTGAFILGPMPDGTSTGGNARGNYAIDLQSNLRSSAAQVASGLYAVAIGTRNQANGENAIAIGLDNTAGGYDVVCIGKLNTGGFGGVSIGWLNSASNTGISIGQGNTANGDTGISVGSLNTASAQYSITFGRQNVASATRATAIGTNAGSTRFGMYSYADGMFAATGDAQKALFVARNKTTNTTPTVLFLDGSSTRLTIPSGKMFLFEAKIVGVRSDGLRRASYVRKGTIINVAGSTSIVGAIEAVGTDVEDDPNLNITITADDTNDALDIQVTGITGETWRWVAVVEGVEVAYGT